MTINSRDVVIVGAGIVGCLTAYLLARQGLKVTLLEKDSVGSHASGFAFGEMGALEGAGIPDPLLDFSVWSLQRHRSLALELKEASGVDNQFQPCDRLTLAFDEPTVNAYRKELQWQQEIKEFKAQWLEPEEVVKVEPMANPRCLGGVYVQNAGSVEPYRHVLAAAQAGERVGVETLTRRVTGLITGINAGSGRCLGVSYQGGSIRADIVVLAMGPWTQEASEWCGTQIPVRPLKGQILRLQHSGPPINTSLHWRGSYLSSKPDGLVWAGTTEEEVGFDEEPTRAPRDKIMEDLLQMAPTLTEAQLVQQTACLRPLSSDGLPIVGKAPGWDNLYVSTGAGRKGILWSTGMGFGLADLILQGKTEVPGMRHLGLERFAGD